jgi:hypothetical protein
MTVNYDFITVTNFFTVISVLIGEILVFDCETLFYDFHTVHLTVEF